MSERFTKVPQNIMRGHNPNNPDNLMELGLITFLRSHADNFKVSQTSICRQFNCDSRTFKKIVNSLFKKGYIGELQAIKDFELLVDNNTPNHTAKKTQKSSKAAKKTTANTNNMVLLNYNSSIVNLQQQVSLNNNTRRLKENQLEKEINKEKPLVANFLNLDLKEENPLTETDKPTEIPKPIKPRKLNNTKTHASELLETIPLEFIETGKAINKNIDLAAEYLLFRKNKITKNHTSTNWITAWESWLNKGINKYGKGQIPFVYVNGEQKMDTVITPVEELTSDQKQEKLHRLQQKIATLSQEYAVKKREYDSQSTELFNQQWQHERGSKEWLELRNKTFTLGDQWCNYKNSIEREINYLAQQIKRDFRIPCNDFYELESQLVNGCYNDATLAFSSNCNESILKYDG